MGSGRIAPSWVAVVVALASTRCRTRARSRVRAQRLRDAEQRLLEARPGAERRRVAAARHRLPALHGVLRLRARDERRLSAEPPGADVATSKRAPMSAITIAASAGRGPRASAATSTPTPTVTTTTSVSASVGFRDRVFYTASYNDEYYVRGDSALNQEVSVAFPLPGDFEVGGAVGYFDVERRRRRSRTGTSAPRSSSGAWRSICATTTATTTGAIIWAIRTADHYVAQRLVRAEAQTLAELRARSACSLARRQAGRRAAEPRHRAARVDRSAARRIRRRRRQNRGDALGIEVGLPFHQQRDDARRVRGGERVAASGTRSLAPGVVVSTSLAGAANAYGESEFTGTNDECAVSTRGCDDGNA